MYQDPKRVRKPYARINLDDYEAALIDALVNYTGGERAATLRQLLIKEAVETLGIDDLHESTMPARA